MKTRIAEIMTVIMFSCATAWSRGAELDQLQGKWAIAKTNQEGQAYSQTLQIEKDQLTFQVVGSDSKVRLFSRGTVKVTTAPPFDVLTITDLRGGLSEQEMQAFPGSRVMVYTIRDGNLFLASNFDTVRENEKPGAEMYVRQAAGSSNAANPEAKLVGKWKMEVALAGTNYDYELRITKTGNQLAGVLVSPRSGEHACKLVRLEKDNVTIEVDREIEGTKGTFVYQAKLKGSELSGQFSVRGHEDETSGTWKASKQ